MEKIINCKSCNGEIAKGVTKCPHCGIDQRNFFMKHKFLSIILVLILLGIIGPAMNHDDTADTDTTVAEADNSMEVTKNTKETISEKTSKETETSNMFDGGINEMFGIDDGSGFYAQAFKNLDLNDNIELTISNGVTIKLIPVK